MDEVFNLIGQNPAIAYATACILIVYLLLEYVIKNPTKRLKLSISLGVGFILALIWYFIIKTVTLDILIVAYLAQAVFYDKVIKPFFKKNYNNNKGVL